MKSHKICSLCEVYHVWTFLGANKSISIWSASGTVFFLAYFNSKLRVKRWRIELIYQCLIKEEAKYKQDAPIHLESVRFY